MQAGQAPGNRTGQLRNRHGAGHVASPAFERQLDCRRAVLNPAEKPAPSGPSATATRASLRDGECDKRLALLSRGPPPMHETWLARSNPRSHTKNRPPLLTGNMTSSGSYVSVRR